MAIGREQLKAFIADCGKIPPEIRRELRPALREGAQPILDDMRRRAHWSTRIPGATKISTSLAGSSPGVAIVTDARTAPHARVYEHNGEPGIFRAPLWGDTEHWYAHRARPFFWPAVSARGDDVVDRIDRMVGEVLARHGF